MSGMEHFPRKMCRVWSAEEMRGREREYLCPSVGLVLVSFFLFGIIKDFSKELCKESLL